MFKLQAHDIVIMAGDWGLASHRGESVCKIGQEWVCSKPIDLDTEAELDMSIAQ